MNLDREQVTAAELAGCQFRPARADEVQRFAMQRRIFFIDGQPHLALRSDGFCETAGTLEPLIAYGRARLASLPPAQVAAPDPVADPAPIAPAPDVAAGPMPEPKRRGRPPKARSPADPAAPPKRRGRPPKAQAATPPPAPPVSAPEVEQILRVASAPAPARPRPGQPSAPRWLTAGAERRGRSALHWSTRRG